MYANRYSIHMSESTLTNPAEEKDTKEARLENPSGISICSNTRAFLFSWTLSLPCRRVGNSTRRSLRTTLVSPDRL